MLLFGVKDDFANPKAKFKDIILFSTDTTIHKISPKHINNEKPYRHTYWFTDGRKAELFEAGLWQKYKGELKCN